MTTLCRAAASLFTIFLVTLPAFGLCPFSNVYSGAYRLSALDVAVAGPDLWVATSYGIQVHDISGGAPRPYASLTLPGTTNKVEVIGDLAYVASGTSIHVIRKSGSRLTIVRTVETGSPINDLLYLAPYLYVAGNAGIAQLDLLRPDQPVVSTRLMTSSGPAFSLDRLDTTLYAADGDSTLQAYELRIPSFPQSIGTVPVLPRTVAVHVSGRSIYVSDGLQTRVLSGSGTALITVGTASGIPATIFSPLPGEVALVSGNDRRIRAVDFTSPSIPVTLGAIELAPAGGTINRIFALATNGSRVFAAAGDIGVVEIDASGFRTPFPLRSYPFGASRSVVVLGSSVIAAGETSGISQYSLSTSGTLTLAKQWSPDVRALVHDGAGSEVLTSAGNQLTLWNFAAATVATRSQLSFRTAVRSALLITPTSALVLLEDRSLWRADLTATAGTASLIPAVGPASFMARSGSAVVLAEISEAGSTLLRFHAAGDLASPPVTAMVEGAANSGVTLDGTRAAVVTFRGLSVIDFSSSPPLIRLAPGSNALPARDVLITPSSVLVLTGRALQVWDIISLQKTKEVELLNDSFALALAGINALVTGSEGVTSVSLTGSASPLVANVPLSTNRYFKRIMKSGSQLFLFDGREVDVFTLRDGLPVFENRIANLTAVIDVALSGEKLIALSSSGKITAYDRRGQQLSEYTIAEGSDVTPLSLHSVAGAIYASISRGCLSGGCEKKILVLDPRGNLVLTSTLTGGVVDVSVAGTEAFLLTDFPAEIRILDITNPFSPRALASRASEGDAVSISYAAGLNTVYTLGRRVYAYSRPGLAKSGEILTDYVPDPSGRVAFVEQRLRIAGNCAVITARGFAPQLLTIEAVDRWTPAVAPTVPAAAHAIADAEGYLYILTDYSLEVWSSVPRPRRRRLAE